MISAGIVNATLPGIPAGLRSLPVLPAKTQMLVEALKTKSKAELKGLCGVSGWLYYVFLPHSIIYIILNILLIWCGYRQLSRPCETAV